MDSSGLQLLAEPAENQLLLIGGYNPYLLFLAWLVACTACVATRISNGSARAGKAIMNVRAMTDSGALMPQIPSSISLTLTA